MFENEFLGILSSSKISFKELQYSIPVEQEADRQCAHRALWRAVITQALMDAGSNSKKIEMKKEKARAIAWLNSDSEDFIEVCEMADYNPAVVKRKALMAIKNGCKWREEKNPILYRALPSKNRKKKHRI